MSAWEGGCVCNVCVSKPPGGTLLTTTASTTTYGTDNNTTDNNHNRKSLASWEEFYDDHDKYFYVGRVVREPIDPTSPLPPSCKSSDAE